MFREGDRLLHDLECTKTEHRQALRVGISAAIARSTSSTFLMPLLRLEGCSMTIRLVECTDLLRELRAGTIDLVVCENTPPDIEGNDLDSTLIKAMTLVAIAAPSFVIEDGWHNTPLLQYGTGARVRGAIEDFIRARDLKPTLVAEADDANFLVEAAAAGAHLVIVPASVARSAISANRVRVIASIELDNAGVYAIHRRSTSGELVRNAIQLLVKTHGDRSSL
jgi:DNA-binding transcriptional LysR family regulator